MTVPLSIQLATPHDLDEIVRIDDEATTLYASAGYALQLSPEHPFVIDEQARWRRSAEHQRLFFATDEQRRRLGFAALDIIDGAPYLDQLSVRESAMRRGAGRFLLRHAIRWAAEQGGSHLWLTTYAHLPWNAPFYQREGFHLVPESEWGPEIRHHVEAQRRCLPAPEHRVAMRRPLTGS